MATQAIATTDGQVPALIPAAEHFALRQRQARMFAMSLLVPEHLRKGTPDQAMANCYIALALAEAMGEMPLIVMQNIHVISGKAGFASKYMIARANSSGKFKDDVDWDVSGKGQDLSVTCFATLAKSGKRVEMTVDMAMAKAEGWTKNAKYQTMPEVMLRYRSASFLVNMYAPEVMLGYKTVEEYEDMGAAQVVDVQPLTGAMLIEQASETAEIVDAETGEVSDRPSPADTLSPDAPAGSAGDPPTSDEQEEASDSLPAREDSDHGEAHTTADAEADIIAHIGKKVRINDVNALINSRIGELDDDAADRVRSVAMERISWIRDQADA